jgi:hypothetical protein
MKCAAVAVEETIRTAGIIEIPLEDEEAVAQVVVVTKDKVTVAATHMEGVGEADMEAVKEELEAMVCPKKLVLLIIVTMTKSLKTKEGSGGLGQ